MMTSVKDINRALTEKSVNHFYCTFLKVDKNSANILGRQVKSIGRPNLNYNDPKYRHKGHRVSEPGRIDFGDVTLVFFDDAESLVTKAIYRQLYKQSGRVPNISHKGIPFDINVKVHTPDHRLAEEYTLKECWIISVDHSEQIYADSTNNYITCRIRYNTADYQFL